MWFILGGLVIAIAAFIFGFAMGLKMEDKYDIKKDKEK